MSYEKYKVLVKNGETGGKRQKKKIQALSKTILPVY